MSDDQTPLRGMLLRLLGMAALLKIPGAGMIMLVVLGAVIIGISVMVGAVALAQSMITWPVEAPRRPEDATRYAASGWRIAVPYGWISDPERPGAYRFHEGITLVGEAFCLGCPVPPIADLEVRPWGVRWDEESADPLEEGAGVVVEAEVQHPDESGSLEGSPLIVRYGHLQPYRVYVRTQACQRQVSCPRYEPTQSGRVSVECPGDMIALPAPVGEWAYAYATPGRCRARVRWPRDWTPDGPTEVVFDQRIIPGRSSADAAISFRAQAPPPTPTPTPVALSPTPVSGGANP